MRPEETYLQHLRSIERIAAFVARRSHLNKDDAAEFTQEVRVRLLDDNYAVIRKFEGRSSFTTYLTTVIMRLFHQWRVEQWGKWRPSAEARRLGDKAVAFERLMTRDGFTFAEAVKVLTTPGGSQCTVAELEAFYLRLPLRNPRPIVVSDEELPDAVASGSDADELVERHDRVRAGRHAARTMDSLLEAMEPDDRLMLKLRFCHGLKVPDIARRLQLDQKKIYKRLDHIYSGLRRKLEAAGVRKHEIAALLMQGDSELHFGLFAETSEENALLEPSHPRGEIAEGGEDSRL